jgi:hypothetical protein
VVTASDAGESAAVLQLKPTVRIARASGGIEVADLRTEEFDVSFTADRTPGAIFSSIWAALLAGAAGVTTFVAAYFAIRRFRRRNAPDENDPGEDPGEDAGEDAAARS